MSRLGPDLRVNESWNRVRVVLDGSSGSGGRGAVRRQEAEWNEQEGTMPMTQPEPSRHNVAPCDCMRHHEPKKECARDEDCSFPFRLLRSLLSLSSNNRLIGLCIQQPGTNRLPIDTFPPCSPLQGHRCLASSGKGPLPPLSQEPLDNPKGHSSPPPQVPFFSLQVVTAQPRQADDQELTATDNSLSL